MKKISILGSTGSIGKTTLQVAKHLGADVVALAAHSNVTLLEEQIHEFHPEIVALVDSKSAEIIQKRFPDLHVVAGEAGVLQVAAYEPAEMVISAIVGFAGIKPTVAALSAGKSIGLANKESIISSGNYLQYLARENGASIIPIDSEHSALFQCFQNRNEVRRLILTASGGPFLSHSKEALAKVTRKEALNHPNWSMGAKISVDSSTLMNKGLEVIEAHILFDIPYDQIDVVIHPQSIVHSLVEYVDGALIAQLGAPDMVLPIQYALTYPERLPGLLPPFEFPQKLEFSAPDPDRFRCLPLAIEAGRIGGTMPCFMSAANEVLVDRFLEGELRWSEIASKLENVMGHHSATQIRELGIIESTDKEARELAHGI